MPGYIEYTPDIPSVKFLANVEKLNTFRQGYDSKRGGNIPVRRPYQSIRLKDDTYAVLSVVDMNNKTIPLVSHVSNPDALVDNSIVGVEEYTDFILRQVTEQRVEKQQIVDTFGDFYVFFYGEQPRVLSLSGLLVNTEDYNWRSQFWYNYENYFRGTKLVQINARVYLAWDTIVIEGYPLQATASEASTEPYSVNFSMSILLTNYYDYSSIGIQKQEAETQPAVVRRNTKDITQQSSSSYVSEFTQNQTTNLLGTGVSQGNTTPVPDTAELKASIAAHNLKVQSGAQYRVSRALASVRNRTEQAVKNMKLQEGYAAIYSVFSQAGGVYNDLADQASIARRNFGMFASRVYPPIASGFYLAEDPTRLIRVLLGMDIPSLGSLTASPMRTANYYLNRASNIWSSGTSRARRVGGSVGEGYIGAISRTSFSQHTANLKEQLENGQSITQELGQSYVADPFLLTSAELQPNYDQVYGDRDYGEAVIEDAELMRTLEETYGDVDNAIPAQKKTFKDDIDPYTSSYLQDGLTYDEAIRRRAQATRSDVDPASLTSVYAEGVSSRYVRSPEEILSSLREMQSNHRVQSDEDTAGIRGVDDAIIEPVI